MGVEGTKAFRRGPGLLSSGLVLKFGSSFQTSLGQVQEVLLQLGWTWLTGGHDSAGRVRIHRLRKLALNYTLKKASVVNRDKYTVDNMLDTFSFLTYIPSVPRQHVKYLDECAFVERDLHPTRCCRSLPGEHVVIHSYIREEEQSSYEGRYIVTFLTSLVHPRGGAILSIKNGTKNALGFADAVMHGVSAGFLVSGDKLILDNAAIHHAKQVVPALKIVLGAVGVELVYLPRCSPALDPAEFTFQWAKEDMRRDNTQGSFLARILRSFAKTCTQEKMRKAYDHCIP